jgi:hypothetical protein
MSSNRLIYDECAYQQKVLTSTSPMLYSLYIGAYENCNKCRQPNTTRYIALTDIESELRNQTRYNSKCNHIKYNPSCVLTKGMPVPCISTYDKRVPIELSPEVCPIVPDHERINRVNDVGYRLPDPALCRAY